MLQKDLKNGENREGYDFNRLLFILINMEKNILLPVRQFHIKAAATRGVVLHTDFPLMGSNDLLCDAETKAKMLPVAGERFINQHGLAARELQWNYRYGWKWLAEMVPAKWSDFEGWRENF